jgi:4-aminobutyrate aminotransferase-like enzyme
VSCAAAMAVLDVIEGEGLQARAGLTGEVLRQGLSRLAERFDYIGDVRGSGLAIAAEIVAYRAEKTPDRATCARIVNGMRQGGVLMGFNGIHANVLKIRPPLAFGPAEAEHLLRVLEEVLARL